MLLNITFPCAVVLLTFISQACSAQVQLSQLGQEWLQCAGATEPERVPVEAQDLQPDLSLQCRCASINVAILEHGVRRLLLHCILGMLQRCS